MATLLARFILSIALLLQGVGAIASEIGVALHSHCHMAASSNRGKPAKMPCCHCDECTVPACATGCAIEGMAFVAPLGAMPAGMCAVASPAPLISSGMRSVDFKPPLRPPIA